MISTDIGHGLEYVKNGQQLLDRARYHLNHVLIFPVL